MSSAPRFRYIGITDDVVDCERPGCTQAGLKSTVVIMPLDADGNDLGEVVYYGSTCAARALAVKGGGRAVVASARAAHAQTLAAAVDARKMLDLYALPYFRSPNDLEIANAAVLYAHNHRTAAWAAATSGTQWRAMVVDMVVRKQAAVADAEHLAHAVSTPVEVAVRARADQAVAELARIGIRPSGQITDLQVTLAAHKFGQEFPAMARVAVGHSDLERLTREFITRSRDRIYRAAHLTAAA